MEKSSQTKTELAGVSALRKAPPARLAREAVETVAFVLVLVSVLRGFGAEAFEIPTGSMATTLHGTHKRATCPQCGYASTVNARSEIDDEGNGKIERVHSCQCQNCRYRLELGQTGLSGGDRVLVAKYLYSLVTEPKRWEVVVFKCPERQKGTVNYIKRLVGLPGETVEIRYGDLYIAPPDSKEFEIARKPAKVMLAMRRLVFDNDHQPRDLLARGMPPRWQPQTQNWEVSTDGRAFNAKGGEAWLAYNHLPERDASGQQLISDFESYNTKNLDAPFARKWSQDAHWVGDLMIEADVELASLDGHLEFELNKGERKYVLSADLAAGKMQISGDVSISLVEDSPIAGPGKHHIRFSDFDDRLTAWVNGKLVFGDGIDVPPAPPESAGPTEADLTPVRIGLRGAQGTVSGLKLFRDTYYTRARDGIEDEPHGIPPQTNDISIERFRGALFDSMRREFRFEVPDDSYFMLGDNSPQSQDGRLWGETSFVSRKMVLGRALVLYWPPRNWTFVR